MLFRDDGLNKFDDITSTRGCYCAISIGISIRLSLNQFTSVYPLRTMQVKQFKM